MYVSTASRFEFVVGSTGASRGRHAEGYALVGASSSLIDVGLSVGIGGRRGSGPTMRVEFVVGHSWPRTRRPPARPPQPARPVMRMVGRPDQSDGYSVGPLVISPPPSVALRPRRRRDQAPRHVRGGCRSALHWRLTVAPAEEKATGSRLLRRHRSGRRRPGRCSMTWWADDCHPDVAVATWRPGTALREASCSSGGDATPSR